MGVSGLTTFAQSIARSISDRCERGTKSKTDIFVIDAWGFIYFAFGLREADGDAWYRGGDFAGYEDLVRDIISSLLAVNLKLIFVFDGPTPYVKQGRLQERLEKIVTQSSSFMRASANLKASPSFLRETRILPPLMYLLTLQILQTFDPNYLEGGYSGEDPAVLKDASVHVQFTNAEADPQVALLAEHLNAFAVAQDSDFFVLCGRGRCCRYVALNEISWPSPAPDLEETPSETTGDDGFEPVGRRGRHQKVKSVTPAASSDTKPSKPSENKQTQIVFTAYSSQQLASHLKLPASMLSLLAALLGNDYSNYGQHFFRGLRSPTERVYETARVIQGEWTTYLKRKQGGSARASRANSPMISGSSTPVRSNRQSVSPLPIEIILDPVRHLVEQCVIRLLDRAESRTGSFDSGIDRQQAIENIIDSVCAYGKTHPIKPEEKELQDLLVGQLSHSNTQQDVLERYIQAYRRGEFGVNAISCTASRHVRPLLFVEDPSIQAIQITHCRELRQWIYAILFQAYGLDWARTAADRLAEEARERELIHAKEAQEAFLDEVVSVATSNSDDSELSTPFDMVNSTTSLNEKPDPYVWEDVRRGDHLSLEPVRIDTLLDLFRHKRERDQRHPSNLSDKSIVFQIGSSPTVAPTSSRLSLFFFALSSDYVDIQSRPFNSAFFISCIRHCALSSAMANPEKRSTAWWRPREINALASLIDSTPSKAEELPVLSDDDQRRTIQLSTALQLVSETAIALLQALVLPCPDLAFYRHFAGHRIYHALATSNQYPDQSESAKLISANLEDCLFVGATKSERKQRKQQRRANG